MNLLVRIFSLTVLIFMAATVKALSLWQDIETLTLRGDKPLMAKAVRARHLQASIDTIRSKLLTSDTVDLDIPLPDGKTAVYRFEHSPIAEQALLDKFPDIKTFRGTDVNDPNNQGRFDISPMGFRGMFRHQGETIFIDPQYMGDEHIYLSYYAREASPLSPRVDDQVLAGNIAKKSLIRHRRSDGLLRTYRLAVAATGEYTAFFGGTVRNALSAIVTAINRVNEIYERDLGIRLLLVGNNDLIVYTDSDSDPYQNMRDGGDPTSDTADLVSNQRNIDTVIGNRNYDIGHVLGANVSLAIASPGVVCNNSLKAWGLSFLRRPVGDSFHIDFLAHEIGHQFGASHTSNGTARSCRFRDSETAYEVGSGSTIMAYAGLCGAENLQQNSDSYFHVGSIEQIASFVQSVSSGGRSCSEPTSPLITSQEGNSAPVISSVGSSGLTIPANTPFVLTGKATDVDDPGGSSLSYVWEQIDLGTPSSSVAEWVDDGSRPFFRSIPPSNQPSRYFPNLSDVLEGTLTPGESYPTVSRLGADGLDFRFTVRDGKGGTHYEDQEVFVTTAAGPFTVRSPTLWTAGTNVVSWDVANTNRAPVNCRNVSISLSSDESVFAYNLTPTPVPNNGSARITTPSIDTTQARIKVSCADNVFYAVNNARFTLSVLQTPVSTIQPASTDEGGTLRFVVTLASTLSTASNYSLSLVNNTTADSDVGAIRFTQNVVNNNGLLTVPAGVNRFEVQVSAPTDSHIESDETLTLYLGGQSAVGTISDASSFVDTIVSPTPAIEGTQLTFSVSLTASTTAPQAFSYNLALLGSTSRMDYLDLVFPSAFLSTSDTITVPAGVLSFDVLLNTFDDLSIEGLETLQLSVGGKSAIGTIVDNDSVDEQIGSTGTIVILLLLLLMLVRKRYWSQSNAMQFSNKNNR